MDEDNGPVRVTNREVYLLVLDLVSKVDKLVDPDVGVRKELNNHNQRLTLIEAMRNRLYGVVITAGVAIPVLVSTIVGVFFK
jgi:hypothetical protein